MQWRVSNEEEAIKAFISKTGKMVKETGIWFIPVVFLVHPLMGLLTMKLLLRPSAHTLEET